MTVTRESLPGPAAGGGAGFLRCSLTSWAPVQPCKGKNRIQVSSPPRFSGRSRLREAAGVGQGEVAERGCRGGQRAVGGPGDADGPGELVMLGFEDVFRETTSMMLFCGRLDPEGGWVVCC